MLMSDSTIHKTPNCTGIHQWDAEWHHKHSLGEEELTLVLPFEDS